MEDQISGIDRCASKTLEGVDDFTNICLTGELTLIEGQLKHGVDVNQRNDDGSTALTWVSSYGTTAVLELLVRCGASVMEERPIDGRTSLHRCASNGELEQIQLLLKKGGGSHRLEAADQFGRTPLGCAVDGGRLDVASFLLESGADANGTNPEAGTLTPVQLAFERGDEDMVMLLIANGADIFRSHLPVDTEFIAKESSLLELYRKVVSTQQNC